MIPVETFVRGMHQHQIELFEAFDNRRAAGIEESQTLLSEWHRRARKTTLALNLEIREACRVPNSKYGHIAPTQVQARNIVWDDPNMLKAYLPDKREMGWKLNEQKMLVTFENGSMLKIGGADEPDSWRGTDFVGLTCDEWSLMQESLWTEILRPVIAGELPSHIKKYQAFRWAFFIYTPKPEGAHATRMFDTACCLSGGGILPVCGKAPKMAPNTYASRLDGELSGIYSQSALNQMQQEVRDGRIPQAEYDQEIKCSRITREQMTLITTEMIHKLNKHHAEVRVSDGETRKIVSIDPAWGGDVCQIMGIVNHEARPEHQKAILDKMRTSEICMAAKLVARQIGTKNFVVDTVNAPGVADNLAEDEAGYNVQQFKSSFKPSEKKDTPEAITFANLRAQAYHYTSVLIHTFQAGPIKDAELMRQLPLASRYTTQPGSGKLIIQPKVKIKEELGCSPDKADCYIMGNWGLQFVQPEGPEIVQFGAEALLPDYVGV
ncbi:MAG: hypothetical protein ABIF19_14275 [Planctomycetota bacterium]